VASSLEIAWTPLPGGKYTGKTLPQVLFADPDYFYYLYSPDPRSFSEVRWQADVIAERAKHIAIPPAHGAKQVAEYFLNEGDHRRFEGVVLMPETQKLPLPVKSKGRKDVFDLSYPRLIAPHDGNAGKRLVEQVKEFVLHDRWLRMNKRLCEQFYDDPSKFTQFALPAGKIW
jgi:hypothetical protein